MQVLPIHKSRDKTHPDNYRPIWVFPIRNIFLKSDRLFRFFIHFHLFESSQFRFKRKLSTSNAFSNILQFIFIVLDPGFTAFPLLLNFGFSKAFSCVDRTILLHKFNSHGVWSVALIGFQSYLSERLQYFSINVNKSDHLSVGICVT